LAAGTAASGHAAYVFGACVASEQAVALLDDLRHRLASGSSHPQSGEPTAQARKQAEIPPE